ncbi:inositol polyphosphate phosphatase [Leucosporidium creatinivorum]|uniref:Inositol polyphosphate phosphatase n=1 Tax=Leucosporidium creatinivorum TaxID=106004 RepID=A0A1Y2C3B2_9BASI|nr:inositol polyphosphate phosphatase [Leucosporidium creatinivorum]
MLVHVWESPRIILLEEEGYVLAFSAPEPNGGVHCALQTIEEASLSASDRQNEPPGQEALGCLGLLRVEGKTHLAVVTQTTYEGPQEMGEWQGVGAESVYCVREVQIYCLDDGPLGPEPAEKGSTCFALKHFLGDGSFFYSGTPGFDITMRLAERLEVDKRRAEACAPVSRTAEDDRDPNRWHCPPTSLADLPSDPELLYNIFMLTPLFRFRNSLPPGLRRVFDIRGFAVPICQGYFSTCQVEHGGEKALLTLISRRRWARAGPRFIKRGIDEQGNVANFAETETILRTSSKCWSFVEIRGSVPLFWKERPSSTRRPDISIHEPLADSLRPFRFHFYSLFKDYGPVHILDLMNTSPKGTLAPEEKLGAAYAGLDQLASNYEPEFMEKTFYRTFDVQQVEHAHAGVDCIPARLAEAVEKDVAKIGATLVTLGKHGRLEEVVQRQEGVFRVNCRDCCDRTNLGQWIISRTAISQYLAAEGLPPLEGSQLERSHRILFSENGDALATIYAGSPAMNSAFVRSGRAAHHVLMENIYSGLLRRKQQRLYDPEKERETEIVTGVQGSQEVPLLRVDQNGALLPM